MQKKYYFAAIVLGSIVTGLLIARFHAWDWLEPVLGVGSLLFAAAAMLEAQKTQRVLNAHEAMTLKQFSLTIGLREGYGEIALIHSTEDVLHFIQQWMEGRIALNLPVLTGMVQASTLVYPVRNGEEGNRVISEPTCQYVGTLSAVYDKNRTDDEIMLTLSDLARSVGEKLHQKRVYCSFADKQWVVELEWPNND